MEGDPEVAVSLDDSDGSKSDVEQLPQRYSTPSSVSDISEQRTTVQARPLEVQRRSSGQDEDDSPAAQRLPREIIAQILYCADPNTFASLVLLSREWWQTGQSAQLYSFHLSRCPSYSASNNTLPTPADDDDLSTLRKKFSTEIRRNLFEVFLRPNETVIELVSSTTGSSVAFPGGEAFHFSFSHNGRLLLAFNSSRIYIIDLTTEVVAVKRELKILRRPASVAIVNNGATLAVLSTDHEINIYDLNQVPARHLRALSLDNAPRTVAVSPSGSVLAAAYEGGIEVYSLATDAVSTDRRGVRCDPVDSLSFSGDETLLLGTTIHTSPPSTVVLSAPYYSEGQYEASAANVHGQMWTTQILFPNSSRDCSHGSLLSSALDGDASWIFAHDYKYETSRAVRVDDVKTGTSLFPRIPTNSRTGKAAPTTLAAASHDGELVAAGYDGDEVWLFGIPEDLDFKTKEVRVDDATDNEASAISDSPMQSNIGYMSGQSSATADLPVEEEGLTQPEWKRLCKRSRNSIKKGHQVANFEGVSALKWVSRDCESNGGFVGSRLVGVAPGGLWQGSTTDEPSSIIPSDAGRIKLLDFSTSTNNGGKTLVTIEVGNDDAELLEEEDQDLEAEVAVARRRRDRGGSLSRRLPRSQSVAILGSPRAEDFSTGLPAPSWEDAAGLPRASHVDSSNEPSLEEVQDSLDAPYSHTQPRSRSTLHRAATAVAVNRRYNPPSIIASGQVSFRRPDGRGEIPDESDADNWVPPPPPYRRDSEGPLPTHLQMSLIARSTDPIRRVVDPPQPPPRANTSLEEITQGVLHRARNGIERAGNSLRVGRSSRSRSRSPANRAANHDLPRELAHGVASISVGPETQDPAPFPSTSLRPRRNAPRARPLSANFAVEARSTEIDGTQPLPGLPTLYRPGSSESLRLSAVDNGESQRPGIAQNIAPPDRQPREPTTTLSSVHLGGTPPLPSVEQRASLRQRASNPPSLSTRRASSAVYPSYSTPMETNVSRSVSGRTIFSTPSQREVRRSQSARAMSAYVDNSSSRASPYPPLGRMDTIHSVVSRVTSTRSKHNSISTSPRRRLSRAERSAAINVKQAKKRGWNGISSGLASKELRSKRLGKRRTRGSANGGDQSEAWTDVSANSTLDGARGKKRCIVM
ncbi:MAG: mitochondrial inner membrane protein required for protein import [Chaenotheca gracillima]|nr:MAG: mitochondrial inner membrane protein required for protein import [Chaenotheca gracillima]